MFSQGFHKNSIDEVVALHENYLPACFKKALLFFDYLAISYEDGRQWIFEMLW